MKIVNEHQAKIEKQWQNPTETLDTIIGILTGLPVTETYGMDAIGVASDVMNEIMKLRMELKHANEKIKTLEKISGYTVW